jgi:tRNA A-37 threonylcarbamoyl transferase component Bud32/membrane-associated phospholipid phosphatase
VPAPEQAPRPTPASAAAPTSTPTSAPTAAPAAAPTAAPAPAPAATPPAPTSAPAATPTSAPTSAPDGRPGLAGGPTPTLPRLRRPSGYPPPLPLRWSRGEIALPAALALWLAAWIVSYLPDSSPVQAADAAVVDFAARDHRNDVSVALARVVDFVDRPLLLNWVALATVLGAAVLGRFRRAFVQLGVMLVAAWLAGMLAIQLNRPLPYDVDLLGRWSGYAAPEVSMAYITAMLIGAAYCFLLPGRRRVVVLVAAGCLTMLFAAAKAVLGVNFPTSVLAGGALGALVAVLGFTLLVPDGVFPMTRRGIRSAHLDLEVRRPAIEQALATQLGLRLRELEPFGLAGSGGSSPMRLVVDGRPEPLPLFAKLYSRQHVRADRWYKLGRALRYGRLEDERPFRTVRRMVQNEDYLLRVLRDAGLPVVRTYGFVELTPEREYLLVTEFAAGAREISDEGVGVDAELIDDGLRVVRGLWDAGLAHRDIKPSNLLVRDGRIVLIDVAFAEVHPSPWRQAVDLANMMLVLALRSDAETVYRRALRYFSPEDLAEALAASGGVTLPSQSRSMLAQDGRQLLERFRQLAPPRPPVKVQRWSPRRVGLLAGCLVGALLGALLVVGSVLGVDPTEVRAATCPTSTSLQLFGQAVPSAAYVPCVPQAYSLGYLDTSAEVRDGLGRTESELPDGGRIRTTFSAQCRVPIGRPLSRAGLELAVDAYAGRTVGGTGQVLLTFPGGCVQLDYPVSTLGRPELALPELRDAVRLVPRWRLDRYVARITDGREGHL